MLLTSCGTKLDNSKIGLSEVDTQETTSTNITDATEISIDTIGNSSIETTTENIIFTTIEQTNTQATTTEETTNTTLETTTLSLGFDDEQLIQLANSLHEVACEMAWNYFNSSPYPMDYNNYIQDEYGNMYFLINDNSITSIDDVKKDWLEIFSNKYNEIDFGNHFVENDGKVYVHDGSRGADITYSNTEITEISSKSSDQTEVFFKAVSHYVDPADNSELEDQIYDFSIILENGSYHVGQFTLPY